MWQRPCGGHHGKGCPCPLRGRPRDRNRRRPRIRRALGKTRASDLTIAHQASACGPLPSSCAACGLRGNAWGRAAPAPGSEGKGLEARTEQGRAWAQQETYTTGLREGWPRARATAPPRHRKEGQGCGSCPTHNVVHHTHTHSEFQATSLSQSESTSCLIHYAVARARVRVMRPDTCAHSIHIFNFVRSPAGRYTD